MSFRLAQGLLASVQVNHKKGRLLGLSISNLNTDIATTVDKQLSLTS